MEQIILVGGGGHAASVIDSILQQGRYKIAGIVERKGTEGNRIMGFPILGNDDDLAALYSSGFRNAFVTVGYLGKSNVRERIYDTLKRIGYFMPTIIDPSAVLAEKIHIEEGTYVGKKAVVNTNAHIGKMCIVNTGAIVEHDNTIGSFSHIAVGSILCGNVQIGDSVLVGAGAVVIQNVHIGKKALVGAGITVRHDVEAEQIYYGK